MFISQIVLRLPELVTHCPTEVDQFVWFSGGILFWLIHWRSLHKMYGKRGLSKLEQKIIPILGDYEASFENEYCVLIRKADY